MTSPFKPGETVVCVEAERWAFREVLPGDRLTVRRCIPDLFTAQEGGLFWANRFRSLTPADDAPAIDWQRRAEEAESREVKLATALEELHAMVWGECPSLLDEDSGGHARLDITIRDLLKTPPVADTPQ